MNPHGHINYQSPPAPPHPATVLSNAQARLQAFDADRPDLDHRPTARQRERLEADVEAAEDNLADREQADAAAAKMSPRELAAQLRRY